MFRVLEKKRSFEEDFLKESLHYSKEGGVHFLKSRLVLYERRRLRLSLLQLFFVVGVGVGVGVRVGIVVYVV